ncbi:MAG: protein-L-isoaspartate(D-aspartate) O-methyltransferase [Thermoanaerobaculia bacterium]
MTGGAGAQDRYAEQRERMVDDQIAARGVRDDRVLTAMKEVPRHLFVPESVRDEAYTDEPLPIGDGQTISQPYIVALMTSLLGLDASSKVLEIGTGSGYQAAVLSRVAGRVYTIEIRERLGLRAEKTLQDLGFDNIEVRIGNGYLGWPEEAPFDAIIVTAAPEKIPSTLVAQLKLGGRMVVPVGSYIQDLKLIVKTPEGLAQERVVPVRFVPMIGEGADQ